MLSAALLLALIAAWWQFGPFDLWPMHAAIAFMVFAALRAEGPISRAVSCAPLVWLGILGGVTLVATGLGFVLGKKSAG